MARECTDRSRACAGDERNTRAGLVTPPRGGGGPLRGLPAPPGHPHPPRGPGPREGSFSEPSLSRPPPPRVPQPRSLGVSGSPSPAPPVGVRALCLFPIVSASLQRSLGWRMRVRCLMPARGLCLFTCRSVSPQCPLLGHLSCVSWGVWLSLTVFLQLSRPGFSFCLVSPSQSLVNTCALSFSVCHSLSSRSVSLLLLSVPPGLSQFLGLSSPSDHPPTPAQLLSRQRTLSVGVCGPLSLSLPAHLPVLSSSLPPSLAGVLPLLCVSACQDLCRLLVRALLGLFPVQLRVSLTVTAHLPDNLCGSPVHLFSMPRRLRVPVGLRGSSRLALPRLPLSPACLPAASVSPRTKFPLCRCPPVSRCCL